MGLTIESHDELKRICYKDRLKTHNPATIKIRVLPRVFAHYTSARRRYAPHDLEMTSDSKIKRVIEIVLKKAMMNSF